MEHYALRVPSPAVPVPPGTKLLRTVSRQVHDRADVSSEVSPVVGLQPIHVYHYVSDDVRPVEPDPALMSRHGWRFRHLEFRYCPIYLDEDGRPALADPDDPAWRLSSPDTTTAQLEPRLHEMEQAESSRLNRELIMEDRDQGSVEGD